MNEIYKQCIVYELYDALSVFLYKGLYCLTENPIARLSYKLVSNYHLLEVLSRCLSGNGYQLTHFYSVSCLFCTLYNCYTSSPLDIFSLSKSLSASFSCVLYSSIYEGLHNIIMSFNVSIAYKCSCFGCSPYSVAFVIVLSQLFVQVICPSNSNNYSINLLH
jgi:hypothetical protein